MPEGAFNTNRAPSPPSVTMEYRWAKPPEPPIQYFDEGTGGSLLPDIAPTLHRFADWLGGLREPFHVAVAWYVIAWIPVWVLITGGFG